MLVTHNAAAARLTGKVGRSAAVGHVPLPKAQVVAKQDWSYVSRFHLLTKTLTTFPTCMHASHMPPPLLGEGIVVSTHAPPDSVCQDMRRAQILLAGLMYGVASPRTCCCHKVAECVVSY